jgi:hypothetical protein
MRHPIARERVRQALRSTCLASFMTLATLAAIEIVLRVAARGYCGKPTASARLPMAVARNRVGRRYPIRTHP